MNSFGVPTGQMVRLVPRRFRGFPAPRPLTRGEMSRRRRNVIFDLRQVIFALRASEIRLRRVSVSLRDVPCASYLGASGGSPPPFIHPLTPAIPPNCVWGFWRVGRGLTGTPSLPPYGVRLIHHFVVPLPQRGKVFRAPSTLSELWEGLRGFGGNGICAAHRELFSVKR